MSTSRREGKAAPPTRREESTSPKEDGKNSITQKEERNGSSTQQLEKEEQQYPQGPGGEGSTSLGVVLFVELDREQYFVFYLSSQLCF